MGVITITHDDSRRNQRLIAAPYLYEKGLRGTFYMLPGEHVGAAAGTSYMTVDEAREVQDVYGHECCTHALNAVDHDNTSLASDLVAYEASVAAAKKLMIEQGFTGAHHFANGPSAPGYGHSTYGKSVQAIMSKYFSSRRTAFSGMAFDPQETVRPAHVMHLKTAMFQNDTFTTLQGMISKARSTPKMWVIFIFHDIQPVTSNLVISETLYKQFVDEVAFQIANLYPSGGSATPTGSLSCKTIGEVLGC